MCTDGEASCLHESSCPPQLLQVAIELVPQWCGIRSHAVWSAAADLQQDICVAWADLRLARFELDVHVGVKSVVPSSQPEQNYLLWSVQFVQAV